MVGPHAFRDTELATRKPAAPGGSRDAVIAPPVRPVHATMVLAMKFVTMVIASAVFPG